MKSKIFSALIFILASTIIFSQQISNWQNYTDLKPVKDIITTSDGIWAASSGGAFFYDIVKQDYKTYHRTDGLNGISLSALASDQHGNIWFGSTDGIIDIYNPNQNSFSSILDINNSQQTSKDINDLFVLGDTILASTDFGLSLINADNHLFYDTYFKFGNLNSNIKVNSAVKYDLFYVCTDYGVAIQKRDAINLLSPDSWNVYQTSDGLPSNSTKRIVKFNDSIIVATNKGLAKLEDSTWTVYLPQLLNTNTSDLFVKGDSLFIISNNYIDLYTNGSLSTFADSAYNFNRLSYSPQLGLLAASDNGIYVVQAQSANKLLYPNGPASNQFPDMTVSPNGTFWSASGNDVSGLGFYKYQDNLWINYNRTNYPIIKSNAYFDVYAAPDNTIYLGNWGAGFLRLKNNTFTTFDASNTDIKGVIENPNYIVISGFATDSRNNLWILNFGAVDQKNLIMLTPDSTWHFFSNPVETRYLKNHVYFAIDQYDTKWYACTEVDGRGLYYFNENGTYDNTNDDKYGILTDNNGLNSSVINSIVVDKRGDVWVGTSLGINIISNVGAVLYSNSGDLQISSVFALRQYNINTIAVDPINRKWVGTDQGLLLVNADGTQLLNTYNSTNSPLPSDKITSVTVDQNNGRVYVGTDKGLASFDTPAINPLESFTKLFIYPNPFILNKDNNKLTIDGLIKDSEIKVLTISGKLVTDFLSPGGRVAYWDGRDSNGNLVNTGVYLIVAFDQEANNVTTGKVAIIRK
jgi:ligand-binding sensor domain-containing protein